jgi:hypothetical protein
MSRISNHRTRYTNPKNPGYLIIVFLFWPFIAFVLACLDFRNSFNKKIIIAFFALYGFLFYINPLMDGQRQKNRLKDIAQQPFENLFYIFEDLYEETLDFVEPVLVFIVSRFSDFHGTLFVVYALIFGSLMLYYLEKMYGHYSVNRNTAALLFLIILITVNPIYNINGFRMWTAAWIYAVGVMNYLHKPNYKYVLLSGCSFLVHFSFLPLVALFVVYTFLKNKPKIYGVLAVLTFFVAELSIQQVQQVQENVALLGTASENKIKSYTGEQYIEKVSKQATQSVWYIKVIGRSLRYFILLSLLMVFIKTRGNFKTKITGNFYSFSLLLLSFANISSLLPSGGRFFLVFNIFAFSTMLLYYVYERSDNRLSFLNYIGIPIVALQVILAFRLFSDSASAYLMGPSFLMPFGILENISLESILF